MFILKFQASKAEKLLQANLQSPTRINGLCTNKQNPRVNYSFRKKSLFCSEKVASNEELL